MCHTHERSLFRGIHSSLWLSVNQCNYSVHVPPCLVKVLNAPVPYFLAYFAPTSACLLSQTPCSSGNKQKRKKDPMFYSPGMQRQRESGRVTKRAPYKASLLSHYTHNVCLFVAIYCNFQLKSFFSLFCLVAFFCWLQSL